MAWRRALPLRRIPADANEGFSWGNRHSGSLFDLEPGTTYEIEAFLLDPDGGCELRYGTITTRPVPEPMPGAPVKAVTPDDFAAVAADAEPGDIEGWRAAVRPNTRAFLVESPANPLLEVTPIGAVAEIAHAAGAKLVVDNVFATPIFQKPLALGADVVVYSATKHIDGQGRCLGGVILASVYALSKYDQREHEDTFSRPAPGVNFVRCTSHASDGGGDVCVSRRPRPGRPRRPGGRGRPEPTAGRRGRACG